MRTQPLIPCVALLMVGVSPAAHAQVINVLPLLSGESEDGLHVEATGGGSLLTGNIPFLTAKGSLLARYVSGRHRIISSSAADFGRGSGDPFLNRQTSHLRYQNQLGEHWVWEAFSQVTHDQVWRLRLRALAGTGMRADLAHSDQIDLVVGAGYMFEREHLSHTEDVSDAGLIRLNHRLSSYASVAWRIDPPISIVHTTYFQPRLDDPADLRLFTTTACVVKIKDHFALSTSLQVMYNSWTPETILPVDTTTAVSLTVGF